MELKLKGRVAIIGGASKGLGFACASQLAQEGAHLVLCARGKEALEDACHRLSKFHGEVLPFAGDMSSMQDNEKLIKTTLNKFGKIDILVNNSGGPTPGTFFDFSDEHWEQAFQSVLMYVVRLCKLAIPEMKKNAWGRIVNITSLSVKEPAETLVLSNVFRSGVVSLAKTLSRELIKHNITINNVCPGAFKTDRAIELMNKSAASKNVSVSEIERIAVQTMPLGRYQHPEELGNFVAFLCSELAGGITGTTLQIDGGISKGLL